MQGSLRDDFGHYFNDTAAKRKIIRAIRRVEREALGLPPVDHAHVAVRQQAQTTRMTSLAVPVPHRQRSKHRMFDGVMPLQAPSRRKLQGAGSPDVLFKADPSGQPFWLYASQTVTQRTLGPLVAIAEEAGEIRSSDLSRSKLAATIRKTVDGLMAKAAQRTRCGVLFDLVSTSNIIHSRFPHAFGEYIYEYLADNHADKLSLKFVFVGITDNVNCCAARDVFCRDNYIDGEYVGDTKRAFDALDNVHMYAVFPRRADMRALAFGAPEPGMEGEVGVGRHGANRGRPPPFIPEHIRARSAAAAAAHDEDGDGSKSPDRGSSPRRQKAGDATFLTDGAMGDFGGGAAATPVEEDAGPRPLSVAEKRRVFDRRDWGYLSGLLPRAATPAPSPSLLRPSGTASRPLSSLSRGTPALSF